MSDYIPNECLREILVRLPVKSLLRFRCVSKTWNALISSPAFIAHHLHQAHQKASHGQYILFRHYYCSLSFNGDGTKDEECFVLHKDDESFPHNPTLELRPPQRLPLDYFRIVGSMNGIVCMFSRLEYIFWNPSLNKTIKTEFQTNFPSEFRRYQQILGFGCDHITKDLKLVRLFYTKQEKCYVVPTLVEIFTLSTNSWRKVAAAGPMYRLVQSNASPQVFVSGSFHWIAHTPRGHGSFRNVIVAFDMSNELFSEIALPGCLASKRYLNMTLVLMNGSLALFPDNKVCVDSYYSKSVWIMKEYGVMESWTKVFDISIDERMSRLVSVMNNGELVFVRSWDELFSYNPYTRESKDLHFSRLHNTDKISYDGDAYFVGTHMESLVLLNEGWKLL